MKKAMIRAAMRDGHSPSKAARIVDSMHRQGAQEPAAAGAGSMNPVDDPDFDMHDQTPPQDAGEFNKMMAHGGYMGDLHAQAAPQTVKHMARGGMQHPMDLGQISGRNPPHGAPGHMCAGGCSGMARGGMISGGPSPMRASMMASRPATATQHGLLNKHGRLAHGGYMADNQDIDKGQRGDDENDDREDEDSYGEEETIPAMKRGGKMASMALRRRMGKK